MTYSLVCCIGTIPEPLHGKSQWGEVDCVASGRNPFCLVLKCPSKFNLGAACPRAQRKYTLANVAAISDVNQMTSDANQKISDANHTISYANHPNVCANQMLSNANHATSNANYTISQGCQALSHANQKTSDWNHAICYANHTIVFSLSVAFNWLLKKLK